jgi:two-component system sensor histidine kinase PilS (NtrC family)
MSANDARLIYPCPFSKAYGIPRLQAWTLLKIYYAYRFIFNSSLVIVMVTSYGPSLLGEHNFTLYKYSILIYYVLTIFSGICIFWRITGYIFQAQTLIFTDIVIITLIMHASGGLSSGMGILLIVPVAAGGLLIGGRCAMLFAALASLAILTEQIFAHQTRAFNTTYYTYAGMLGLVFFAIALLAYFLAQRTETTEQTISTLEELNQNIIQYLQSGIIIVNKQQQIRMSNEAASRILDMAKIPENVADISTQLADALQNWLKYSSQDSSRIQLSQQTLLYTRFTKLPTKLEMFYMIMLEDSDYYNQRLLQGKLAYLGRLTASIAHEIRNPLGAISHAGQLLSECPKLTSQDKRLTEIIQKHSVRVNQIIENVLQLSRRNATYPETLELHPWLQEYLHNFNVEQNSDENKFTLDLDSLTCSVVFDPGHLKQILDNLCLNAIKHGSLETENIIIKTRRMLNTICLDVIDTGPGIKPEHQEHLFEPFFTTSATGTGLGLYISRELAELNQAKLFYHSNKNCQSCFRLRLQNVDNELTSYE